MFTEYVTTATDSEFQLPLSLRGIPESGFCEKSEFVNPEMRETLSFQFQKER